MSTLDALALRHGTDKATNHHKYTPIYERYLGHLRTAPLRILELGVGGDEHPDRGGQSLRMWRDYFPNALVVGVDLHEKRLTDLGPRIKIYRAAQTDPDALAAIDDADGPFDVIVDDASHHNALTPQTFRILFPLLKPGGLYFVEDVHTSYWREHFGGNENPLAQDTIMGYFHWLTHQLNDEGLHPSFQSPQFFGRIEHINFHPQLIAIKKL